MSISDFIMGIEDYEDVQRWKKMAKYFRSGDAAALSILFMNEICPDQEEGRNCDLCGREAKDLCDLISRVQAAAEMAEGKIGPGTVAPPCWQITKERVDVLRFLLSGEFSRDCGCEYCRKALETVRAMLTEAGQE